MGGTEAEGRLEKMKKLMEEFKKFALKGNVIDMAVGVMVGGAFSKIVTSLVNDLFMPVLSLLTGGLNVIGLIFAIAVLVFMLYMLFKPYKESTRLTRTVKVM